MDYDKMDIVERLNLDIELLMLRVNEMRRLKDSKEFGDGKMLYLNTENAIVNLNVLSHTLAKLRHETEELKELGKERWSCELRNEHWENS